MTRGARVITCPSCGHQRAEDGEKYCKLCTMARAEEAMGRMEEGLLKRTLRDRPGNEDRIRGIR